MSDERAIWRHWREAAGCDAIDHALREIYAQLGHAIAARGPICQASGRCCHFQTYGHRLYVTGLEIAWLLDQLDPSALANQAPDDLPAMDGCPFQANGLCSVHALRPLGCRVYFCDPDAQSWQNELYERFLDDLRRLHDEHGLEYRYMEWRWGLAEAMTAKASSLD